MGYDITNSNGSGKSGITQQQTTPHRDSTKKPKNGAVSPLALPHNSSDANTPQ
jgi:hypothetical protein